MANSAHFFGRIAYHLFDSINSDRFERYSPIEEANLTVSALYRRALGLGGW
jgi:hypothetical protein